MCLQEEPCARPLISDISAALGFLAMAPPEAPIPARLVPILSSRVDTTTSMKGSDRTSRRIEEDISDCSEDEDSDRDHHDKNKHDDDKSSSDYEYGDSSDESDYEEGDQNQEKVQLKSGPSKNLGSSSKRKSKKKSVRIHSSNMRTKSKSSSLSSRDQSVGFSLRCDSTYSDSRPDSIQESHDHYGTSSSSDDDEKNHHRSSSRNRSRNSRSSSNRHPRSEDEGSDD